MNMAAHGRLDKIHANKPPTEVLDIRFMEREEEKNGKEEIDQFKRGTGDHVADVVCEGKGIEKTGSCDL